MAAAVVVVVDLDSGLGRAAVVVVAAVLMTVMKVRLVLSF